MLKLIMSLLRAPQPQPVPARRYILAVTPAHADRVIAREWLGN